jgi:hypothetical protein
VAALPRPILERALSGPPGDERAVRYCPRCGRAYREEIAACYECDALALVARS